MEEARARNLVSATAVVIALSGLTGVIDDLTDLASGRGLRALDALLLFTNLLAAVAGAGVLARKRWANRAAIGWAALLTFYAVAVTQAILAPARAWWPGAAILLAAAGLAMSWSWLVWRTRAALR